MKKVAKILGISLGIVIILWLIFFMVNCKMKRGAWFINLFKLEEISSITIDTLSQHENKKEFKDEETIQEIYDVFVDKKTHIESVNDVPVNPDILYLVKFENDTENSKSAYIYKKDNKYYIEQPYNGIYQITEEEYTRIEKLY